MKRLLIVEDSLQFRHLLIDLLHGYYDKIYECSGSGNAVKAYKKFKPDYVLMDAEMKEHNGFAATRQIKATYPDARVVLLSSYNDPEMYREAKTSDAEQTVHKENLLDLKKIIL